MDGWNSNKTNATFANETASNSTTLLAPRAQGQILSAQAFELLTNVLFTTIITTGVIGNGLVVATVLRWKEMRSPCNLFLLNISTADLFLTGIGGALRITEVYYGWIFGDFLCRFLAPLQDVFVCVSGITHSTIALERYRATVTPFKPRISKTKTQLLIPIIWVVSYIAAGLPLVITTKTTPFKNMIHCFPVWSVLFRRIYEVYLVAVFIVLQLAIQTFAYASIIRVLRIRKRMVIGSTPNVRAHSQDVPKCEAKASLSVQTTRNKQHEKTIKILIALVAVFQICYIPRGTVMLLVEFAAKALPPEFAYIELISLILYYLKHVLNPLILFSMSTEFKAGLKRLFKPCIPRVQMKRGNNELSTTPESVPLKTSSSQSKSWQIQGDPREMEK